MQNQFQHHPKIKNLLLTNNFITPQQQTNLITNIITSPWNTTLKRRTQHYGYQYNYNLKSPTKLTKITQLPLWCLPIKQLIENIINSSIDKNIVFDQLIVNQYQPGQGISPHIDNIHIFRQVIASLSLGSDCIMIFQKGDQKIQVELKRCSLIAMLGQARYQWKHSIPSRKKDFGKERGVRYSLTFREVVNQL